MYWCSKYGVCMKIQSGKIQNYFYWIFSPHWTFHLPLMHILLTDACKIFMMSATNRCGQVAIFACRFLQISAKILISICLDFSSVNNFILFDIGISFWNFYIIIRLFLKRLLRMKIIIIKDFLLVPLPFSFHIIFVCIGTEITLQMHKVTVHHIFLSFISELKKNWNGNMRQIHFFHTRLSLILISSSKENECLEHYGAK